MAVTKSELAHLTENTVGAEHEDDSIRLSPLKILKTEKKKSRDGASLHPYTRCDAPSPPPRVPCRNRATTNTNNIRLEMEATKSEIVYLTRKINNIQSEITPLTEKINMLDTEMKSLNNNLCYGKGSQTTRDARSPSPRAWRTLISWDAG
jgi:peptidoglycan hydrolase CwlO-like protein